MKKKYRLLLLLIVLLTAVKLIFVGSNTDEGYGIELAWRLAGGDRMLLDLWEPHQTSAIFGAVLINLFRVFSGGSDTGIVLYMHIWGIVFQFLTAYLLYRVLKYILPQEMGDFAFLGSCVYALCFPKGVIAPEYSNLQNWFMTCSVLCFILFMYQASGEQKESGAGKKEFSILALSGVFLSGTVLAYPSMALLYPVMIILLCCNLGERRLRAVLALTVPCLLLGGLFIGYLFSYMTPEQIMQGISYVFSDGAHAEGPLSEIGEICLHIFIYVLRSGICYGAAYAGMFCLRKRITEEMDKGQMRTAACLAALAAAFVWQTGIWLFRDEFVNQPQTELFFLCVLSIVLFSVSEKDRTNRLLFYLVIFSITGFAAAILLSNFMFTELVGYLSLGAVAGAGMLYRRGKGIFQKTKEKKFWEKPALFVMGLWVVTLSFGRIWVTSQGGELHTTLFEVRNIQKSGPGIGILTNYMTGHRYNTIAGEWADLVQDGEALLYVGPSSFYYMFGDVVVSAPNTISTPVYDEMILDYWEMHPERYPDVVFVESCYGEVMYDEEEFIMKWLNTEYNASSVTDLEYIRVYRK